MRTIIIKLLLPAGCLFLSSCVGPASPFGALNDWSPRLSKTNLDSETKSRIDLKFSPDRQVLHKASTLKVLIKDPNGFSEDSQLKAFYNGFDITSSIKSKSLSKINENQWLVKFENLKLNTKTEHNIQFQYQSKNKTIVSKNWPIPNCEISANKSIQNTEPFKPNPSTLTSINKWSKRFGLNPNFIAGLIAQESGFNPKAISWAKAIGLTQMTPIADKQILPQRRLWLRSEEITNLPVSLLKPLLISGGISDSDDWRLNPDQSIQGGILYIEYLQKYWNKPQNKSLLAKNYKNRSLTNIILASYNSGSSRVNSALKTNGDNYLNLKKLKEAKKYVRRVNSFCYHFSHKQEVF